MGKKAPKHKTIKGDISNSVPIVEPGGQMDNEADDKSNTELPLPEDDQNADVETKVEEEISKESENKQEQEEKEEKAVQEQSVVDVKEAPSKATELEKTKKNKAKEKSADKVKAKKKVTKSESQISGEIGSKGKGKKKKKKGGDATGSESQISAKHQAKEKSHQEISATTSSQIAKSKSQLSARKQSKKDLSQRRIKSKSKSQLSVKSSQKIKEKKKISKEEMSTDKAKKGKKSDKKKGKKIKPNIPSTSDIDQDQSKSKLSLKAGKKKSKMSSSVHIKKSKSDVQTKGKYSKADLLMSRSNFAAIAVSNVSLSSSTSSSIEDGVIAVAQSASKEPITEFETTKKEKKAAGKGKGKQKKKFAKEASQATDLDEETKGTEKKKKKKKGKEAATTEDTEEEDDITKLMKSLASPATELGDETSVATAPPATKKKKAKKKAPKKKLSQKEKIKLAAEMAEKAKLEEEEQALRAAEEERIRLEQERKAAIEKEQRETMEQGVRREQLEHTRDCFKEVMAHYQELARRAKNLAEWEFYVSCDRLPDAAKCNQITTYLHLWEKVMEQTTMQDAAQRTQDVLQLLHTLDSLIDLAHPGDNIDNWKWVRQLLRDHQAQSLDVTTYRLLRDIENNLNRIDIPTADFRYKDNNFTLCLWLRVQLPTPIPNPRRPPKPRIHIMFNEMNMNVLFPETIDCEKMAIRAVYLKYDHLSDLSHTYQRPEVPREYELDLWDSTRFEWWEKMKYKFDQRPVPPPKEHEPGQEGDGREKEEPQQQLGYDDEIPRVPYQKLSPSASEYVISKEDSLYSDIRDKLRKATIDDEINLRKFTIIGGVYMLNLVHQPPQPQDFVTMYLTLTPLYIPKELEFFNFSVTYTPPPPPAPGVRRLPEEIEEEMKKQEEELDKLMLVTLTWPDHVIFLELPLVCYWDRDQRIWTKGEVHDLKHNEEKGQLTFRTGKFGIFALAAYRYANLPYQAWEVRPEADGTITLQITAAILIVEFSVNAQGQVALSQLQNSPNNALQDLVGVFFELPKLARIMQEAGVDVFPAFDTFCYVEGTCEKHWPMEKHLYFNMAQIATCFNFAWSRWNLTAGRRSVVMQMREYKVEKAKQKNHSMLHVTPLKAIFVDCTEVSQTFNEEGVENMKFCSDLYHLMKGTSNIALRNKVGHISKELVYGLYELLVSTRIVSFS